MNFGDALLAVLFLLLCWLVVMVVNGVADFLIRYCKRQDEEADSRDKEGR